MEFKTKIAIALVLAFVLAIVFFSIGGKNPLTGLISLTAQNNSENSNVENAEKNVFDGNNPGNNADSLKKTASVSSEISFEVVQPTELKAKLVEGKILPCPQFSNLVFEVENIGKSKAERIFFKHSENLKVENCINCLAKELMPSQKLKISMKACLFTEKTPALAEFSSINAVKKEITLK